MVVSSKPLKAPRGPTPKTLRWAAKSIKVTLAVDPVQLLGIAIADGVPQVPFVVAVAGRHIKGLLNAKTLRRAVALVTATGAEGVAVIIQGRLGPDEQLIDAGIAAQPKGPTKDAGDRANAAYAPAAQPLFDRLARPAPG